MLKWFCAAYTAMILSGCSAPMQITNNRPHGLQIVRAVATEHNVSADLAEAVAIIESRGNCKARSDGGALGVMQVMPSTARSVGVKGPMTDCTKGATAGVLYLRRAIDLHGNGCEGISAYAQGIDRPSKCLPYGRKVMKILQGLEK